jgi:UPF0716 protein FxsA
MWFFLWILAEIAVFIIVGSWIGIGWTLLLIVATTVFGFALVRTEGLKTMQKMHAAMRQGGVAPAMAGANSSIVMLAGMFLIIPGFISDLFGLLLLIPGVRHVAVKQMRKSGVRFQNINQPPPSQTRREPANDKTIEGECWEDDNKNPPEDKK